MQRPLVGNANVCALCHTYVWTVYLTPRRSIDPTQLVWDDWGEKGAGRATSMSLDLTWNHLDSFESLAHIRI